MYRYRLINQSASSSKYGNCEVCGKPVSEVYSQYEEESFNYEHNGQTLGGWTQHNCNSYFGHQSCLINKRR